ncbi:unnamed protein product [Thelazia callipaeda]|uniref:Hexamethylene bis-acetamide inducible 1 n=1 Tax=Thelazia callipaeda TaxID=103827 RepID=A0A0N5DA91_THECL|nr:unnamed protein product [Thelazia callipaeda]
MTATVIDQADQQQQQDQEKQRLLVESRPGGGDIVLTMEGVDEKVSSVVLKEISPEVHVLEEQCVARQREIPGDVARGGEPPEPSASASRVKTKKPRRRRGGKGRWKPYHKLSHKKFGKEERGIKRRESSFFQRLFSRGKPMAPYNTTQFIVEDHERRTMLAEAATGADPNFAPHARRILSPNERSVFYCSYGIAQAGSGGNTTDTASYSGAEDDQMEREFDADYDYVNMERICSMSKDGVVREYMHLEKLNSKMGDRLRFLELENDKLKQLLNEHNILYDEVLTRIRRHSAASISEAGEAIRRSLDEVLAEKKQTKVMQ